MPSEFIVSPDAVAQLSAFEIFLGLLSLKAMSNECLLIRVIAAPVSNNNEKVLFPTLTFNCGLILSPLKGAIISNSLLQVAMGTEQKLRIS
jgi:hypothetical protein